MADTCDSSSYVTSGYFAIGYYINMALACSVSIYTVQDRTPELILTLFCLCEDLSQTTWSVFD